MSENIKYTPSYIISNEILFREGTFTIEDILEKVKEKLLDKVFGSIDQLREFIKSKVSSLCDMGLVSDTGFFYYVN